MYVWGSNEQGELALGDYENRYIPVLLTNLKSVIRADTGFRHTVLLLEDSQVITFGDNSYGQLGYTIDTNITENKWSYGTVAVKNKRKSMEVSSTQKKKGNYLISEESHVCRMSFELN